MKSIEIQGTRRTELGSKYAIKLRKEGKVPCVVYGGSEPVHFYTDATSFRTLAYTPAVYEVSINLGDQIIPAIMQELQFHPVSDAILHVDFVQMIEGKMVQVDIPLNLLGNARGVRSGGKLKQNLRRITVKALPQDLPDSIDIDITNLRIGQSIKVEDIKVEGNFSILNSGGAVIVSIKTSRKVVAGAEEEEEEEEAAA